MRTRLPGSIVEAAARADSLRTFREQALVALAAEIRFDAALFHALSPRVPLDTAVVIGLDVELLRGTMAKWDRLAVELGRLRDVALAAGGVATDRDAFPVRTRGRERFQSEIARPLQIRAMAFAHLMVRGTVRAGVLLFQRRANGFPDAELAILRSAVPALSIGDTMHSFLDDVPRAALPLRMACVDQRLTRRQREIVEYVALGHTNDAIARTLAVSPNTLRNHLADVFRRLGASNRADVVRLAVLRATPP
jgi:DNA-binding CsgD family transcriptional regulator